MKVTNAKTAYHVQFGQEHKHCQNFTRVHNVQDDTELQRTEDDVFKLQYVTLATSMSLDLVLVGL